MTDLTLYFTFNGYSLVMGDDIHSEACPGRTMMRQMKLQRLAGGIFPEGASELESNRETLAATRNNGCTQVQNSCMRVRV